jgi:hypothetical protein
MTTWTSYELKKIEAAEELQIASVRGDDTLRNWTTIWMVRVGDDIYVRSVSGRSSAWFRSMQTRHEGRIRAGGVVRDVTFVEESDVEINDQIDAAYRMKYSRYSESILNQLNGSGAQATTIKLVPQLTS